jgi:phosphoglycolate phosphatase
MKNILFDLDGTISNSKDGITKCVQYALQSFDIYEDNLNKLEAFIGPPLVDSFMKYYNFSETDAKEATTKYRQRYSEIGVHEAEIYPNVEKCLIKLKNENFFIGLASSKPENFCKTVLADFNIIQYFDDIAGATLGGKISSKKDVLEEVFLRNKNLRKEDSLLIGDTVYDVLGAKYAGISCIGVSYGFGNVEEMKKAGAIAVIDDILELIDLLKSL